MVPDQQKRDDYWMEQMLAGNFENAWKFSDEVLEKRKGVPCFHLPRHQQYIWNGTSLENKCVLVRCYHGLGDTIQFVRFMPQLKKIARRVIVWAQEPLIPLLKTVEGIDEILPLHDGAPGVDYDVDVEIMELAHVFRITPSTIPKKIPYIHTEPMELTGDDTKMKIGLMWKVGEWDSTRSIPFSDLSPLFEINNTDIYILQHDPKAAGWQPGYGIYPGNFRLYDFARLIRNLDLVVTVDAMPTHLAGSQGIPVFVLLKKYADWRWMSNRKDSPWYPTVRLFRQKEDGNWSHVVQEAADEIEQLVNRNLEARQTRHHLNTSM